MDLNNIMPFKRYNEIKEERNEDYWPVFFSSDVLILYKYKDEYLVSNRRIEKNGELICSKFFLSSGGDQVVITKKDFNYLPNKDKKYWKFFRESAKSDINESMYKNIYLGEWIENDPITNIKEILKYFPKVKIDTEELDIWKQPKSKTPHNIEDLYYVVSGSKREWINELLTLDKNIVEGFQGNNLKKIIGDSKNKKNYGSINLLEECLKSENIAEPTIKKIIGPLRKIRNYRSKIIAHNGEDFPKEDLRKNFKVLVEECNDSLSELSDLINENKIF